MDIIKSVINFHEGNKYVYWQDFRWLEGIPSNVDFTPKQEINGSIVFTAIGYGILSADHRTYGSGAIYVQKTEIPHLLHACFKSLNSEQEVQGSDTTESQSGL